MPQFFGLCGRFTPTPCRLSWASTYPNKVGIYPSDFLPSQRTVYHASSDSGFNFRPPIVGGGETFGLPFGGAVFGGIGGFDQFGPPQFDIFTPQTHTIVIFAQTANRVNVPHVVTQAEFLNAQSNGGIALIDVGEYIYEFIGVTDQREAIEIQLTQDEIDDIEGTDESESDRAFRKLFEQIPPVDRNRFSGIELNKLGIEYRFDNGGPKVNGVFKLAGIGDLKNASYRDGSSRVIRVDFNKVTTRVPLPPGQSAPPKGTLQAEARAVRPGDIIYFTYVAIKEHYMRQSVEASYTIQAISLPPQAFGFPSKVLVTNYRFFEWNINPSNLSNLPVKVGGWRIVESFNVPTNVVAPIKSELGQFLITGGRGAVSTNALDTRGINEAELEAYIVDRPASPRNFVYSVNLNQQVFNASYHQQSDTSFKLSEWYLRGNFTNLTGLPEVVKHVFYNVHPKALLKRDVDKFGIERFLAQEVEIDIKNGKDTFFPFMDDVNVLNPIERTNEYLSSSNTTFSPIQPITPYTTANLEIEAGVAGSIQLGNTGSSDDVIAVFNFNSNIVTERFNEDTRVLVERHFSVGQRGPRIVAIEGAGFKTQSISCVVDPSNVFSFVTHINSDSFLTLNKFAIDGMNDHLKELTYRPDLDAPPQAGNDNPLPSQFNSLLGFAGLLGGIPGVSPGYVLGFHNNSDISSFRYKTSNRQQLISENPRISEDQVDEITPEIKSDRIIIPIESGYSGRTEIFYTCQTEGGVRTIFQFKSGSNLTGVIDSVLFQRNTNGLSLVIPHYWMYGDSIHIVGNNIQGINISSITVQKIDSSKAEDFLSDGVSSTSQDRNEIFTKKSIFFETDVMSIGEDNKSRLFVFFNDSDGGISCIQSDDFNRSWYLHYGVIEPISQEEFRNPFIINSYEDNGGYLFCQFMGKIMCKFIPYQLFSYSDAMLIQRFEQDVLQVGTNETSTTEGGTLYSSNGNTLRRDTVAYAAAGNIISNDFRILTGRNPENGNNLENTEERIVTDRNGKTYTVQAKINPIAVGLGSAFTRQDIEDIHFSAYKNDAGVLKLFFLLPTSESAGGGNQLQCHFSQDGGRSWFDYWEWIENSYNRVRIDRINKTQFIDRSASSNQVESIESTDPLIEEDATFGINVHWSRLSRHKEGDKTLNAESIVIDISSPYVFYQSSTNNVFIFYIYQSCLLCKIFNDGIFTNASLSHRTSVIVGGMKQVKEIIERKTRSYFVDGDLSSAAIREEIHSYYNSDTQEIMSDGNIILDVQWGINNFNQDRKISSQRVCAHEIPQGGIRVLYKHDKSKNLRAAIWTGGRWIVEDLMKHINTEGNPEITIPNDATRVCGGFGGTGFPCE